MKKQKIEKQGKNYEKSQDNEKSRAIEITRLEKGGLESVNYPLEEIENANFSIKAGESTFGIANIEDKAYLECDKGYYPLTEDKMIVIGREKENSKADITIKDRYISGEHFGVSIYGDEISIYDLESKNGTQIEIGQKSEQDEFAESDFEIDNSNQDYEPRMELLSGKTLILNPEHIKDLFILAGETKIDFESDKDNIYLIADGEKIALDNEELLNHKEIIFGRNELAPNDKKMSRQHFGIRFIDEDCFAITDKESTNKTIVKYLKQVNKS